MLDGFVLVAVTFWVVIGLVIVANSYFVYQVRMARYRVMQTLADKGQPVPVELLSGATRKVPVGLWRAGIVLVCLALALGGFFWSMTDQWIFQGPIKHVAWLPTIALFPGMIGVSLLIMAMGERNRPN